jgi:hypothetical protein
MRYDIEARDRILKEIEVCRRGNIENKIKAVDMAFDNFQLSPTLFSVIKELAKKAEPKEVRVRVATRIKTIPLKVKQYREVVKILSEEADSDILQYLRRDHIGLTIASLINSHPDFQSKIQEINKIDMFKVAQSATEQQAKIFQNMPKIDMSKVMQSVTEQQAKILQNIAKSATEQQAKILQNIAKIDMSKVMQSVTSPSLRNDYLRTAKPYVTVLDFNKLATIPLRNQLKRSVGFYPENELQSVKSPPKLLKRTKESKFDSRLKECEPGKRDWKKFQDICEEILCHCLVPPLIQPLIQPETRDGLHIRDLIFNIPYELNGFWSLFLNKFGLALIIECKNYASPVKENQLRISSKYVGEGKLTTLGILVTRKGLHRNGIKAQENIWKDDKKMILCMSDAHIKKMLQLKNEGDEPWKVIDSLIRDFLLSLS